ncbi:MAG: hypothetical protein AAF389_12830, partial [Gemmatimonadota bacterium]
FEDTLTFDIKCAGDMLTSITDHDRLVMYPGKEQERRDFLGITGLGEEDADKLLQLIDELTVVEGEGAPAEGDDSGSEDGAEGSDSDGESDG